MLNIENQLRDYMQNDRFKKTLACFIGLNLDLGKPHAQLAINNLQSKLEVKVTTHEIKGSRSTSWRMIGKYWRVLRRLSG